MALSYVFACAAYMLRATGRPVLSRDFVAEVDNTLYGPDRPSCVTDDVIALWALACMGAGAPGRLLGRWLCNLGGHEFVFVLMINGKRVVRCVRCGIVVTAEGLSVGDIVSAQPMTAPTGDWFVLRRKLPRARKDAVTMARIGRLKPKTTSDLLLEEALWAQDPKSRFALRHIGGMLGWMFDDLGLCPQEKEA
tara:strand:+ start:4991 stop:5569 length:579 start_codon:yes stop_codon:yes gene_type:complete